MIKRSGEYTEAKRSGAAMMSTGTDETDETDPSCM